MRVPKLRATFVQEGSAGVLVVSGKWSLPRWSSPVTVRLPGRLVGLSYLPLGALCGALRCGALRCSAFVVPLWRPVLWFLRNVARNSLACISNIEITSLELQRFLDT